MISRQEALDSLRSFLAQVTGDSAQGAHIQCKPLRGGLEASEVSLVTARYRDNTGRRHVFRFVVKWLHGRAAREAAAYEQLASAYASDVSPRILAIERASTDRAVLYMEAIRPIGAWPWRDLSLGRELLVRLALFHDAAARAATTVPAWDYEAELAASAEATRMAVDRCRRLPDLFELGRDLAPVTRIVLARSALRRQLLSEGPLKSGPVHGDVHPGNVIVCHRRKGGVPVLVDWARARIGSPFEDVSSWLQSLGYWEPEAKRRHDTLLATYLSARGLEQALRPHIRAAYWLAGASNALAGALFHHLCIAQNEHQSMRRRTASVRAARDWLRVIRRADAWWS